MLFRSVLAHPKLSSKGFVASTMSLISWIWEDAELETFAMYCIIRFAASVLPAPDSPLQRLAWQWWDEPDDDTLILFITFHVVER